MWKPRFKFIYLFRILMIIFIFDGGPKEIAGFTMKFTNLECVSLNESVAVFEQCDLKPTPQGTIGLNVHTKLLQALTNIKVGNIL